MNESRQHKEQLYTLFARVASAMANPHRLELLDLLRRMSLFGHAQFIVATHSPILLACPGATIYTFDRVPLAPITYEETEHYRIYHRFMQDRNEYLGSLELSEALASGEAGR